MARRALGEALAGHVGDDAGVVPLAQAANPLVTEKAVDAGQAAVRAGHRRDPLFNV